MDTAAVDGRVSVEDYKSLSTEGSPSTNWRAYQDVTVDAVSNKYTDLTGSYEAQSGNYTFAKGGKTVSLSEAELHGGLHSSATNIHFDGLPKTLVNLGKYGSALDKAGFIGDLVGTGIAVTQAQAAYENGYPQEAGSILTAHLGGLTGGFSFGAVSAVLAGGIVAAVGAPVAIGVLLVGAAGLAGGYIGGEYGEDLFKDLYEDLTQMGIGEFSQQLYDDYIWGLNNLDAVLSEAGDGLSNWMQDLYSQFTTAQTEASPLVLDLDGDGVELTSLHGDGAVYWDVDQDGMAEASGWVAPDDGLLALDRNGNGAIDNHSELFGTESEDGFVMLSSIDNNGDGVIDDADTDFADLRVWQDANGDGISQADELHTLADLNISEISLNATAVEQLVNGNTIRSESTFTMNGQTYDIADAWFAYDNANTVFAGDYNLDVRTLFLPTARGYGNLPDLHIAMSLDETLLDKVETIATASLETLLSPAFDFAGKMTEVLYRWAGVENVDPNGRGSYVDGQQLAFLEALNGQEFTQSGNPNPYVEASQTLTNAYNTAFNALSARVLVQSAGAELFAQTAQYNPVTDEFDGGFVLNFTAIETAFDDMNLSGADLAQAWNTVIRLVDTTVGLDTLTTADHATLETMITNSDQSGNLDLQGILDTIYEPVGLGLNGTSGDDTLIAGAGNDSLDTGAGDDTLYGRQGNDTLYGESGNDTLYGEAGHDVLHGGYGQDSLTGGAGDDTLYGGYGDDVYYYDGGIDTIVETAGVDTLVFASGITPAQISIE